MNVLGGKAVKQFLSYFCVGGAAALVEWTMFFLFSGILHWNYLLSTCCAFVVSTTVNWLLGKLWTFRDNTAYRGKEGREAMLVFLVSAVGLGFNMLLMYLFVERLGMDSDLLKTASKIAATGIVFIWNFLIRKMVIYRENT